MYLKLVISVFLLSLSVISNSVDFTQLKKRAENIASTVESMMLAKYGMPDKKPASYRNGLFLAISESIGETKLSVMIIKTGNISNSLQKPIRIVFRGIHPEDKTILDFMKRQQWLFRLIDKYPLLSLSLDPIPFTQSKISKVPAAILIKDESVNFSLGFLAFRDLLKNKDTSVVGDVYEITEVNLMDMMRAKVSEIDMEKQAKRNHKTYWERYNFINLPTGKESYLRAFNPSVTVVEDIRDKTGKLIAKSGSVINPMKAVPFNRVLITFNPEDERQMLFALEHYNKALASFKVPVLLASKFNAKKRGWGFFSDMNDYFGTQRVFILPQSIVNRFNLKSVPSIVEAHPTERYMLKISEAQCLLQECKF